MVNINPDMMWSIEAEASVLGSMIKDSDCISKVLPLLTEDMFCRPEHQIVFTALLSLYTNKAPTDAVALRDELKTKNQLKAVGGVEYIAKVMDSIVSSADIEYYAKIIAGKYRFRNLITSVEQMEGVLSEPIPVDDAIEKVRDIALAIETDKPETEVFALADHVDNIAEQAEGQREIIPTGFGNIDRVIQGICPGDLCIIAGRPSMGKSTLALGIAINMAKTGKSIVFFTLEMTHRGLIERAIVGTGKVTMPRMRQGLSGYEIGMAQQAADELKLLDIVFHEGGLTPEKQLAFIRARKKSHKVDVIVVDYLQLMNAGRRSENRTQEVSVISGKLKRIAMQEKAPVIVLSQLNRAVESREHHRPRMSDLRDSGSIEQDADFVLLLHREDYYRRNESPDTRDVDGSAEVIIAKARNCPPGIARLTFIEECMRFYDQTKEGNKETT